MLSQVCFGTVSALYDTVMGLVAGDETEQAQHICGDDCEELQPVMAMSSGCTHPLGFGNGTVIGYTFCLVKINGIYCGNKLNMTEFTCKKGCGATQLSIDYCFHPLT